MITIAITGVIGSGKSTIASILKKIGIPVIDADAISREITKIGKAAYKDIVNTFGDDILLPSGEIDRKKLAEIVFKNPEKRKILENIIHPLVQKEREKIINEFALENPQGIIAIDIPLLFEAGLEHTVNYIICTYADIETLYNRVSKRDNMSKEEFLMRLKSQMPLEEKLKRSHFVIDTRKSMEELELELLTIIEKIKSHFIKS